MQGIPTRTPNARRWRSARSNRVQADCVFAPYYDYGDDILAQVAQIAVFFSLVASIVTQAYPNDPVMAMLLPAFLTVPPVLAFVFETPILDELRGLTRPDDNGRVGCVGRLIRGIRHYMRHPVDLVLAVERGEQHRASIREKVDAKMPTLFEDVRNSPADGMVSLAREAYDGLKKARSRSGRTEAATRIQAAWRAHHTVQALQQAGLVRGANVTWW